MASAAELAILLTAKDSASAVLEGLHEHLGTLGLGLATVGAAALAMAGTLGEQGVAAATDLGNSVKVLSRETGLSAEAASGWADVFDRFGMSSEDASRSLGIFSRNIESGSKTTTAALKEMGLSAAKFKQQDLNTDLLQIADRFQQMPDGMEKTAIAMQLFGRSGKDLIPVLDQGGAALTELMDTAKSYGLVITGDNLQQIKDLTRSHKELDEAMGGLKVQLGLALLPLLGTLAHVAADAAVAFNQNVRPALAAFGDLASTIPARLAPLVTVVQALFAALTTDAGALGIVGNVVRDVFGDAVADALAPFLEAAMHLISALPDLAARLQSLAAGAFETFKGVLATLLPILSTVASTVIRLAEEGLGAVLSTVRSLLPQVEALAASLAGQFTKGLQTAQATLASLLPILQSVASTVAATLLDAVQRLSDLFSGSLLPTLQNLIPVVQSLANDALSLLSGLVSSLAAQFAPLVESTNQLATAFGALATSGQSQLDPMFQALQGLLAALQPLVDALRPSVEQLMSALSSLGAAVGGQVNPVVQALGPLVQSLQPLFEALKPVVSALAEVLAGALVLALKQSIDQVTGLIGILKDLTPIAGTVLVFAIQTLTGFLNGLTIAVKDATAAAGELATYVQANWPGALATGQSAAAAVAHAIDAIASAASNALAQVRALASAILSIPTPHISIPSAASLGIPGFAAGGLVPGALGAPLLAVVHGGETITPPGQGGGVNFYGPVYVQSSSASDLLNQLSLMGA